MAPLAEPTLNSLRARFRTWWSGPPRLPLHVKKTTAMKTSLRPLGALCALSASLLLPVAAQAAVITFTALSTQTAITGSLSLDTETRTFRDVDLRFVGSFTSAFGTTVPFDYEIDQIQRGTFNFQTPVGGIQVPYLGDVAAVTSSGPNPAVTAMVTGTTLDQLISISDSALPPGVTFTSAMLGFVGTNQGLSWRQLFLGSDGMPLLSESLATGALFRVELAGGSAGTPGTPGLSVPEPSSLALAGLGLLAAFGRRQAWVTRAQACTSSAR